MSLYCLAVLGISTFGIVAIGLGAMTCLYYWIGYSYLGDEFTTPEDRKHDYETAQLRGMILMIVGLVLEGIALILR